MVEPGPGDAAGRLPPRLAMVAGLVLPGLPLADIGTDHGYLPAYLVRTGRCPRALASDRMPGPLGAARRSVAAAGLADRVELRLGDGLAVLAPGEVATVVLAGMGGQLMQRILAAQPAVVQRLRRLVLQPNAGAEGLRRWLERAGWSLVDEALAEEAGRIYVGVAAAPVPAPALSAADLLLGPVLRRQGGELFRRHAAAEAGRARQALAGARQARQPDPKRLRALLQRLELLEQAAEGSMIE